MTTRLAPAPKMLLLALLATVMAVTTFSARSSAQAPQAAAAASAPAAPSAPSADEGLVEDDDGGFIDTIDVNVVNVEVYVTGKDQERILGLTRDDFELRVGGKPVAITNFYAVENGKARGDGLEIAMIDEPEIPDRPSVPVVETPDDQRLRLVVYIDNFNLRPFTRNRTLGFIRTFLRTHVKPGDEVMMVSYDRSLHLRQQFTSDPELIASALYDLEDKSAFAVHYDSDRRDLLEAIYEQNQDEGAVDFYTLRARATTYAESIYNDMSFSLDALREQVDALAGLPGRKAVLYVSDGLSMRAGEDVFYALADRFRGEGSVLLEAQRYDLSRRFQQLVSQANAHRVTFYTIDAAGLRSYTYIDASNTNTGGGAHIDSVHFSNLQSPLIMMAKETGGMSILNTNNPTKDLNRIASDFNTYYSLGFTPATSVGGRYQPIEVRLKQKRKGVKLRHREGFRDKPVSTRMADTTMAALFYGYQSNPLGVEIEVGEQLRQDDGFYVVPLLVKVPIGKLTFLPQEDAHRGRLRLFVAARDSGGGLAPVQDVPVPITIPSARFEAASGQFYRYELKMQMRSGRQVVAIGVRDEIGSISGFLTRGVLVGS